VETAAQIFLGFIIAIVVTGGAFQLFGRYVYNYRLTDTSIQVVVARVVPVMRIRYADIVEINELTWKQVLTFPLVQLLKFRFALSFGNRIFGRAVHIQKRNGLIRSFVLSPDDVPAFLRQTRAHLGGS
jgi:hypothetical protein